MKVIVFIMQMSGSHVQAFKRFEKRTTFYIMLVLWQAITKPAGTLSEKEMIRIGQENC